MASSSRYELTEPVFLIGFMGAGKTSVARVLARMCGMSSIDLDTYLQRREDKTINQIFEEVGEAGFRDIETSVLEDVVAMDEPSIISCGGGVVVRPENVEIMKRAGTVVHLMVTADEAASRISNKDSRPLFNDIESARKRAEERMPLYEDAADITIVTKKQSVGSIASQLREALEERNVLCRLRK